MATTPYVYIMEEQVLQVLILDTCYTVILHSGRLSAVLSD